MRDLVLGTTYADKVDCIMQSLEMARVTSMDVIDNAPARLGANPCGVDLFDLIGQHSHAFIDQTPVDFKLTFAGTTRTNAPGRGAAGNGERALFPW